MKTEFQTILDRYLKTSQEIVSESSEKNDENPFQEIQIHLSPRYFDPGSYRQSHRRSLEEKHKRLMKKWIESIASEELQGAIEYFYSLGARNFLSQNLVDIKKDYRKLVFRYHPDRALYQKNLTEEESLEVLKKINLNYKKLVFHIQKPS